LIFVSPHLLGGARFSFETSKTEVEKENILRWEDKKKRTRTFEQNKHRRHTQQLHDNRQP